MTIRELHKLVTFLEDGSHLFRVNVNLSAGKDAIQLRLIRQGKDGGIAHYWLLELPITEEKK